MKGLIFCSLFSLLSQYALSQRIDRGRLMKGLAANHLYEPRDTLLARQMLQLAHACLYKPLELPVDLDSSTVLIKNALSIYQGLQDTGGIEKANQLRVTLAWERKDMPTLGTLLHHVPDIRDRLFLLKHISWTYSNGRTPGSVDSAFRYAYMMQQLARENRLPAIANEAEFYIARAYFAQGDLPAFKQHFLVMNAYHHTHHELQKELEMWQAFSTFLSWADTVHPTKIDVINQRIALARATGSATHLIGGLYARGHTYIMQDKTDSAELSFLEANERYDASSGVKRYIIYEMLSKIHMTKGNADKALYYGRAALDNALQTDTSRLIHNVYRSRLAEVFGNFGKQDQFHALMASVTDGLPPERSTDWYFILHYATVMDEAKGSRTALQYLLERHAHVPNTNLVHVAGYAKLVGRLYLATGQLEKARAMLLEAAHHTRSLGEYYAGSLADIYLHLASTSIQSRAFGDAAGYLDKAAQVPKTILPLYQQMNAALMRFQIDSAQGNYLSAIRHFGEHKRLSDSVFNLQKTGQMEELNIRYETEQQKRMLAARAQEILWLEDKARLNDVLLQQTALSAAQQDSIQQQHLLAARTEAKQRGDSLQHAQATNRLLNNEWSLQKKLLDQARYTRNVTIAAVVLLVLLLVLSYNRYRLKQRSNRQLEQQQVLIQSKNQSLERLVDEKEWLLKEVHHRVKNNLQVVMSLLNTQSYYLQDDAAISAIRDSQRRVNVISLIHKKLYQSDNPARVDMPHYIRDLVAYLHDYSDDQRNIQHVLEVDDCQLDIRKAISIGLLLNEAVTNAYKYAFNNSGIITIVLRCHADATLLLSIADNGKGIEERPDPNKPPSLGMSLMQGLARDLEGEFSVENRNGTVIRVSFPA